MLAQRQSELVCLAHQDVAATAKSRPRFALHAAVGAVALLVVYGAIVGGASRSVDHMVAQARADWYLIAPLMVGFGVQVAVIGELRRRRRLHAINAGVGVGGAGASTVGMVACCAHHIVELAPFLGASAAATFLVAWKIPIVLVGLAANVAGIVFGMRTLRHMPPA